MGVFDFEGLVAVVQDALRQFGHTVRTDEPFDGGTTIFSVGEGRNVVGVQLNRKTLAIKINRNWSVDNGLSSRVQSAIEREFSKNYYFRLQFKDVPCGLLGP